MLRRPARRDCSNSWATRSRPAASPTEANVPMLSGSDEPSATWPRPASWPQRLGYPGHRQGVDGRRRPRHARRRLGRRPAGADSTRPSASADGLRRSRRLPREVHSPRPSTSKCRCSATSTATWSISTSAIARSSGGIRRSSRSPRPRTSIPSCADGICDAALAIGRAVRLRERRHGRVPGRCRHRRVLLHRGQPAHPGRAHRHRRRHRHRPGQEPDPDRRRASRSIDPEIGLPNQDAVQHARLRLPVPRDDRGPGEPVHARLRPDHRTIARRAGWASGSTRGTAFTGAVITPFYDSLLVKVTACGHAVRRRRPADGARACRNSASAA